MEALLSCAVLPVPWGARVPYSKVCSAIVATRKALSSCGKAINPKDWDVFSCCQLLPPSFWKAMPYLALCWRLNTAKTLRGWFHSTRQELGVVTSVTSATCAAARTARLPVPAIRGAAARRTRPLNADRSFALRVLVQTDVSVQQSSHPNAKAACSGSP